MGALDAQLGLGEKLGTKNGFCAVQGPPFLIGTPVSAPSCITFALQTKFKGPRRVRIHIRIRIRIPLGTPVLNKMAIFIQCRAFPHLHLPNPHTTYRLLSNEMEGAVTGQFWGSTPAGKKVPPYLVHIPPPQWTFRPPPSRKTVPSRTKMDHSLVQKT